MSALLPSGEQYEITAGDYRAVVVEVGGGLRELSYAGRALLDGFAADALPDGGRGQVLAPWPNRLRDGRWTWDGVERQLPITEVGRANANHGLVRWSAWRPQERDGPHVVLAHRLHPQPGYPFTLDLTASYSLDPDAGLLVELAAVNPGERPVPVAMGVHPYLAAPGGGLVDACLLRVPAATRVLVDERGIPVGTEPVAGGPYDFRTARALGEQALDDAFTDLEPAGGGRVEVELAAPGGEGTVLWTEGAGRWLQVFTGDGLAAARRRRGLAVEPMTAPANALATGEGLHVLARGEELVLRWGVRAS